MSRLAGLLAAVSIAGLVLTGTAQAQADPDVFIGTPTTGFGAEPGVPIVIAGLTVVAASEYGPDTQLTFDGGATWNSATTLRSNYGRNDWSYLYTPTTVGDVTVASRVVLASGGTYTGASTVIHVGGSTVLQPVNCATKCQFTAAYLGDLVPDPDQLPVEVGLKFRVDRPGHVVSAAFLRGSYRGPVQVRLWSDQGVLLAEQPWNLPYLMANVSFASPVPIEAGRDYVISYYTSEGGYATTENEYSGTVARAPFVAPHNGVHGAGVYHYGVGGGFPTDSWHDSGYGVLPEFRTLS